MNEEIRRKERKFSRFFARQFLFEYHEGLLDEDRRKGMRDALSEDPELKKELETLRLASAYCASLSSTKMDPQFLAELSKTKSIAQSVLRVFTWKKWPDLAKWSTEAFLISSVIVGLLIIVPWEQIREAFDMKKSEITRIENEKNRLANLQVEAIEKSVETPKIVAATQSKVTVEPVANVKPIPTEVPKPVPIKKVEAKTPALKGMLYRMMMKVSDIQSKAPDLSRRIQDMGAAKAGNVEMGWRKSDGNYFHFSFPESRYRNLLSVLGEYGAVRVYKNPHERIMPEGQIRIILWIEDDVSAEATGASDVTPAPSTATPPEEKVSEDDTEAPTQELTNLTDHVADHVLGCALGLHYRLFLSKIRTGYRSGTWSKTTFEFSGNSDNSFRISVRADRSKQKTLYR